MPGGHNNDSPGLQTDSRLIYTFKNAGDYLIEVRDTLWRGGDDFWYRLRLGDFPCATTPYPLSVRRGTQQTIHFAGPVAAPSLPFELVAPPDSFVHALALTPRSATGLAGWPVFLGVSAIEELVEHEPNNDLATPTVFPCPAPISARLLETNDVDCFTFAAKKGQRLNIEIQSLEWNSPTEVYMVVKDAKGTQLAAGNPQVGQTIDLTAPADGDFTVVVEHLLTWNGPTETYRLVVSPHEPGFDLNLVSDRFDIPSGGYGAIPVAVVRREYNGPIDLQIISPAGIFGHCVMPAGALAATLFVQATSDMPVGAYSLQVRGSAVIGGQVVHQPARIRAQVSAALGDCLSLHRNLLDTAGAAVTEKTPFAIKSRWMLRKQYEENRSPSLSNWLQARRLKAISSWRASVCQRNNCDSANSEKGQTSIKGTIAAAADAPLGDHEFTIAVRAPFRVANSKQWRRPWCCR